MNWYYADNNDRRGPVSEQEIHSLVQQGVLTPETFVWCEGMENWQPYSAMFPQQPAGQPAGQPAFAPPPPMPEAEALRDGPAWEHRRSLGIFTAAKDTVAAVLREPAEMFARMKRDGSIGEPMFFYVLVGGVCGVASIAYNLIFQLAGLSMGSSRQLEDLMKALNHGHPMPGGNMPTVAPQVTFIASAMTFLFALVLIPICLVLASFVHSAVLHLCLMLFGGAKQSFETTYRVVCYGAGSIAVFQLVPLCGAYIALIWTLVVLIIGLSKAHDTSVGKAVGAVLLPFVVCCGCIFAFAIFFGIAAGSAGHH